MNSATKPVDRGIDYLAARQSSRGLWRDFPTLSGGSTEWVSAYVGAVLAACGRESARECAARAWTRLARRRLWSAGWGYNRRVPADADSTAWALRLADRLDAPAPLARWRGRRFLRRHRTAAGGVATYHTDGPIRRFTDLTDRGFDGWCRRQHPSVTAAALGQFEGERRERAAASLRARQTTAGCWRGYWWVDEAYPTAQAVESLDATPGEAGESVESAVEWALDRVGDGGAVEAERSQGPSPFATALCLIVLCVGLDAAERSGPRPERTISVAPTAVRAAVRRAASWLGRHQNHDGSWSASAALRVPPPDAESPERHDYEPAAPRVGGVHLDRDRVFTTATVVDGFRRVAALGGRR